MAIYYPKRVRCPHPGCGSEQTVQVSGERRVVQSQQEDATLWTVHACDRCRRHFKFNNELHDSMTLAFDPDAPSARQQIEDALSVALADLARAGWEPPAVETRRRVEGAEEITEIVIVAPEQMDTGRALFEVRYTFRNGRDFVSSRWIARPPAR